MPYLEAMRALTDITDKFYYDDGVGVVSYFIANATTWKGDKARAIKAELRAMLKGK